MFLYSNLIATTQQKTKTTTCMQKLCRDAAGCGPSLPALSITPYWAKGMGSSYWVYCGFQMLGSWNRRSDWNSGCWGRFLSPPVLLQEAAGSSSINWYPEAGWFFWFSTDQGGGRRYAHVRGQQQHLPPASQAYPCFCFVFFPWGVCWQQLCDFSCSAQCWWVVVEVDRPSPELVIINISSTAKHSTCETFGFSCFLFNS